MKGTKMKPDDAYRLLTSLARTGPDPAMYTPVHEAFKSLWRAGLCNDPAIWMDFVLPTKDCPSRDGTTPFHLVSAVYEQPLGYAGDWMLMRKVYGAYDSEMIRMRASRWDDYLLSLRTTWSLYCREQYLLYEVYKLVRDRGVKSILDIGCGDGRLLMKIKGRCPEVYCHGIDAEPSAIRDANEPPVKCTFEEMNAIQHLPDRHFDLVLSAGVCDYFPTKLMTRLLRRIKTTNTPHHVIMGNLQRHAYQAEMEMLRWSLIYRDSTDLATIGANVFPEYEIRVGMEEMGINLFLHIDSTEATC